jgi:hypothetical protein
MANNIMLPSSGSTGPVGGSRARMAGSSSAPAGTNAHPSSSSSTRLSLSSALALLTVGKLSRVIAAFASFFYLQSSLPLPLYLFLVTFSATVALLSLQRPWAHSRRIGPKRAKRLLLAGAILAVMLYVWSAGLRSAGPLRTLLIDGAELPLLYVYAVASGRELPERRRTHGAALMLVAYALLVWDASGHAPGLVQLERTKIGRKAEKQFGRFSSITAEHLHNLAHKVDLVAHPHQVRDGGLMPPNAALPDAALPGAAQKGARHLRRRLLRTTDDDGDAGAGDREATEAMMRRRGSGSLWDVFVEGTPLRSEVGVILVLVASVIMQASRPFTRRLAAELGGAKRHFALSVTSATMCLSPLALVSYLSASSGALLSLTTEVGGRVPMNAAHILGFFAIGFLWLVLPYYVRAIVSSAMDQRTALQAGVVVPFAVAAVGSGLFGFADEAGGLSWLLFAAFVLDIAGLSMMVGAGGSSKRALSELPLDSRSTVSNAPSRSRSGRAQ